MRTKIVCQDKYEAQKLASLIFVREGNETFITEILNIFGNDRRFLSLNTGMLEQAKDDKNQDYHFISYFFLFVLEAFPPGDMV